MAVDIEVRIVHNCVRECELSGIRPRLQRHDTALTRLRDASGASPWAAQFGAGAVLVVCANCLREEGSALG